MAYKIPLIALTWAFALLVSWLFRVWGINHPDPFEIRLWIVFGLLFGPSLFLFFYLALTFRQN
ncbi:hypothetical protein [Prochlorococcus marinus]|uniref:hypothetical protein n=1 Tax=Prochlorococcus marinus TaxID=1219 RepID=UPI0022B4090C|nr:hypothetical protein [Prochlorococcus marinus]